MADQKLAQDKKLTVFLELEAATRKNGIDMPVDGWQSRVRARSVRRLSKSST